MNRKKIIPILLVLISANLFYLLFMRTPKIPIDKTSLLDEKGNNVSISDERGNVMIVSYFQSWCRDCIAEQPELEALQQAVGGEEKLKIFLVSDEDWQKINSVKQLSSTNLTFYQSKKTLKSIGIRRFPTTYLIDKNGNVVEAKQEKIYWNSKEIQEKIKQLNR